MRQFFSLVLLLQTTFLFAQVNGRVVDDQSGEGIEYATVILRSQTDGALVAGVVTDSVGKFVTDQSPRIPCTLVVQFMGYETYESDLPEGADMAEFEVIRLKLSQTALDEVEVLGREITTMHRIDRDIYKADQFKTARGGTAATVLGNLPSVGINSFGEITVRGATGFMVMVDGKPSQIDPMVILNQVPANSIQDIEIITSPSAQYDPDGQAGIINIKTNRRLTDGTSFQVNALLGLPSLEPYNNAERTPRYGMDANVNLRRGKWDISGGLDYKRYDISGRRVGYVNTYLNETLTEFPSTGERSFDEINYGSRLLVGFTPGRSHSLSTGFFFGKRTKERTADILYNQQRIQIDERDFASPESFYGSFKNTNQLWQDGSVVNSLEYFNENLRVRRGDFLISSLDYRWSISEHSTLAFSSLYERTILGGPTDNVNLDWPNTQSIRQLQFNDNNNPLDGWRIKADYTFLNEDLAWKSGYQYRFLKHPGDFIYFDRDLENNIWIENPVFTNGILLSRSIHSLYSEVAGKTDILTYSAGLRAEHFDRVVDIDSPDETFKLSKLNLFPSLNIEYLMGEDTRMKFGYSRRIERTTTFKMTPFPEREHSETLEQGDAELLPEYVDLAEVGISKNFNDHSLSLVVYYQEIDNVINRVNSVYNDSILNRIFTNAGKASRYGVELSTTLYPAKDWRVYMGTNFYNYKIKGTLFKEVINTRAFTYSVSVNTSYQFSNSFSGQFALNYLSDRVTAQGVDSRFYNPSLSLQKGFMDQKLTLSMQWQNIDLGLLSSNEQRITTVRKNFYTTTNYIYEVDILQLSITYQFNQHRYRPDLPESEFGTKEF